MRSRQAQPANRAVARLADAYSWRMSRLIDFYRTQIRILWEWRGGRRALVKRLVITLLVSTVSLIVTAGILPGVTIGRVLDAVIAVILMALFNAIVRPVLLTLVAPRSLVLLGILVIAPLANGVHVDGVLSALIASLVYAAVNTALTSILGVDRDGSFFGLLVSNLLATRDIEDS